MLIKESITSVRKELDDFYLPFNIKKKLLHFQRAVLVVGTKEYSRQDKNFVNNVTAMNFQFFWRSYPNILFFLLTNVSFYQLLYRSCSDKCSQNTQLRGYLQLNKCYVMTS